MKYGIVHVVLPWLSLGVLGVASCPHPVPPRDSPCLAVPSVKKALENHRDYVEVVTVDKTTKEPTRWCLVEAGECARDGGCKIEPLPPGVRLFMAGTGGADAPNWNRDDITTYIPTGHWGDPPDDGWTPRIHDPTVRRIAGVCFATGLCQECLPGDCDPTPILSKSAITPQEVPKGAPLDCSNVDALCAGR